MKKKIIIIASIAVVLGLISYLVYAFFTNPERLGTNLAKDYVQRLNSIPMDSSLYVICSQFDSTQVYINKELKNYSEKHSPEDLNTFNTAFKSYSDSVYNKISNQIAKKIYKHIKSNWWYKEGEKDYKNYLFSFNRDTMNIVNRKGFFIYTIQDGNQMKIDSSIFSLSFQKDGSFLIDSLLFKKAEFKDSIVGLYTGASYDYEYDWYFENVYRQRTSYTVIFGLDSNITNLYKKSKYYIKDDCLVFENLKLKLHEKVWFDKDDLKFKGLNCNHIYRKRAEKINVGQVFAVKINKNTIFDE